MSGHGPVATASEKKNSIFKQFPVQLQLESQVPRAGPRILLLLLLLLFFFSNQLGVQVLSYPAHNRPVRH